MTRPSDTASLRARTALGVFDALDRQGVAYAILRNFENVAVDPGRDIDIVVDNLSFPVIRDVIARTSIRHGWQAVCECHGHHEGRSYYFLSPAPSGQPVQQLEIHCTRVRWAGITVLDEREILTRRIRTASDLWVASDHDQGLQIALQRGLAAPYSELKPEHLAALQQRLRSAPAELRAGLADRTSPRAADQMCETINTPMRGGGADRRAFVRSAMRRNGAPSVVRGASRMLSKKVVRNLVPRCGVLVAHPPDVSADRIHALVSPMFLTVVALNPDARGTSTYATACRVINHAGLVTVLTSQLPPGLGTALRRRTVELAPGATDVEIKQAVVDRFLDGHELLQPRHPAFAGVSVGDER